MHNNFFLSDIYSSYFYFLFDFNFSNYILDIYIFLKKKKNEKLHTDKNHSMYNFYIKIYHYLLYKIILFTFYIDGILKLIAHIFNISKYNIVFEYFCFFYYY